MDKYADLCGCDCHNDDAGSICEDCQKDCPHTTRGGHARPTDEELRDAHDDLQSKYERERRLLGEE